MKKILIVLLCILLLLILFIAYNLTRKSNIFDFEATDVKSIEVYNFVIPMEAKGMVVTNNEDMKQIITAFTEIKIKGVAKEIDEIRGGEVISFRFRLKNGEEFVIAYYEGILKNPDGINYKVSANTLKTLWDNLNYDKIKVDESDLPVINK